MIYFDQLISKPFFLLVNPWVVIFTDPFQNIMFNLFTHEWFVLVNRFQNLCFLIGLSMSGLFLANCFQNLMFNWSIHERLILTNWFQNLFFLIDSLMSNLFLTDPLKICFFLSVNPWAVLYLLIIFKISCSISQPISGLFWLIGFKISFSNQFTYERFVFNWSFKKTSNWFTLERYIFKWSI